MRKNLPVSQQEYALPDGAMLVSKTDLKGRITYANDPFVETSGFTMAELLGKAHNIVRHPDMPEEAFADLWTTLAAGKPWTGFVKNRRKNGDYYWVLANATPIRDGDAVTGYMSVRSKPSREQVAAAEEAYRMFRENRAGGRRIREGKVVSGLRAGRLNALARLPLAPKFALTGLLLALPALGGIAALLAPALLPFGGRALAVALGLCLAGGAIALWRLGRRLTGTLRASGEQVEELAQGCFDRIFEADGEDELARLQRSLQSLRTKVGFELADSRRAAVESTRIREALDVAAANVMVADANNEIIYANRSLMQMLAGAEADIRAYLPAFAADKVIGANVDQFHKQPEHQRSMLARLTTTHRTRLTFGARKIDLVITPITEAAGRRIGTVVEWTDRTAELATEEEVQVVVAAANEGNLTRRIVQEGKAGFFATLATGLNSILDANANLVREVQQAVREVAGGADEISRGNLSLSQRTEEQASSLEETASSMEQMTSTVKQNADNAAQANQLAAAARLQAEKGGAVVAEAVTAMQGINSASSKISDIIGVIDDIAFQTNLLALNAAVEAARAGDQGRGFAVVASEVRSLASRSAEAAKEIKALIHDSVGRVAEGSRLVDQSGATLGEIVASVKKVTDIVSEIAAASAEQSSGIEQVNKAVMSMDEVTQQNAALVEEAAAAAESLLERSQQLDTLMQKYVVADGVAGAASAPPATHTAGAAPPERPAGRAPAAERRGSNRPWSKGKAAPGPTAAAPARGSPAARPRAAAAAAGESSDWTEF